MRGSWLLLLSSALFAADERHLAMLREAQAAFDRVAQAALPRLPDASACVQTQAGMLPVALPAEESDLHYRKGFCQLAVAAITRAPADFTDAAAELERSGASMLAWVARRAGRLSEQPTWNLPDNCPESCQPFLRVANLWLGWMALNRGDRDTAAAKFANQPDSGWYTYVEGLRAFQSGRYAEAAARYGETLNCWTGLQRQSNSTLAVRLGPPSEAPPLLTKLGGAQLLAGDVRAAIATLDHAVQAGAPSPQTFYLRARAKELTGQPEPALADYNLASRTAFASSTDLASGEAHLYRGILYYRRKDFNRAEEEFSSALNLEIPANLRPDASAWRHLSAVASGFCGASLRFLEQSLPAVSPYFPKAEAQAVAAGCPAGSPP